MTPKEEIEQFMRGEWTQGGFNRTFRYYGVNWQEGAFEIHWRATEAFTTGQIEAIHGGAIATLLDRPEAEVVQTATPLLSALVADGLLI